MVWSALYVFTYSGGQRASSLDSRQYVFNQQSTNLSRHPVQPCVTKKIRLHHPYLFGNACNLGQLVSRHNLTRFAKLSFSTIRSLLNMKEQEEKHCLRYSIYKSYTSCRLCCFVFVIQRYLNSSPTVLYMHQFGMFYGYWHHLDFRIKYKVMVFNVMGARYGSAKFLNIQCNFGVNNV